jgi:hypothetical protein
MSSIDENPYAAPRHSRGNRREKVSEGQDRVARLQLASNLLMGSAVIVNLGAWGYWALRIKDYPEGIGEVIVIGVYVVCSIAVVVAIVFRIASWLVK